MTCSESTSQSLRARACLQVLIDVPSSDLARELGQSRVTVQGLQNTLQQVLDQREEARQSKQLLELYLRALEKEGSVLSKQRGRGLVDWGLPPRIR